MVPRQDGSARESGEVPNWRGFQDFGSLADVGRFCDCGLSAASRTTECRSRKLARLSRLPRGADITAASPEISHSTRVEKLFSRSRAPVEGPRLLALAETYEGSRNGARPERGRQLERLAERQLPPWLSHSSGVWNSYKAAVRIGPGAIQPHPTIRGSRIHVSSKPSKTKGSVRFLRRADKTILTRGERHEGVYREIRGSDQRGALRV